MISFRDMEAGKAATPPDEWEELFCAKRRQLRACRYATGRPSIGVLPAEENVTRLRDHEEPQELSGPGPFPGSSHWHVLYHRMEFQGCRIRRQ